MNLATRDAHGRLQADPTKFPDGIAPVVDYVHSLGLKFGIYAALGTQNCAHTAAGSWGHYRQDARTFASWGVDFVKVDWCAIPRKRFPGMTDEQIAAQLYGRFAGALGSAGRPMTYSLSTNRRYLAAWNWAPQVGNMWRTSRDMHDGYEFLRTHFLENVRRSSSAGPGTWNDPDMLEVGNGGMTPTEYRTNVSLWAEMAAPLIAGNDLTTLSPATRAILTNPRVIAIDQDRLGRQGRAVSHRSGHGCSANRSPTAASRSRCSTTRPPRPGSPPRPPAPDCRPLSRTASRTCGPIARRARRACSRRPSPRMPRCCCACTPPGRSRTTPSAMRPNGHGRARPGERT